MGSSGVLIAGNVQRGWDWREGLHRNVTGADVLKLLRVGLARDLSLAELDQGGDIIMGE